MEALIAMALGAVAFNATTFLLPNSWMLGEPGRQEDMVLCTRLG